MASDRSSISKRSRSHQTPPTFLVQAENDNVDGVNQSIAYYIALKDTGVEQWLHTIDVLSP